MRTRAQLVGAGLAVLAVVVLTTGPMYRIRTWWSYEDPLRDDVFVVALYVTIAIGAVAVLATSSRWRRVDSRALLLTVALIGWLTLSAVWASDPVLTVREVLQTGGALAAGAALASACSSAVVLLVMWCGLHIGLAWSAVAIALRRPGTVALYREWAGVFFNRNSLGLYAALGVLVSLLLAVETRRRGWRARGQFVALSLLALAVIADLVLLLKSRAVTPLGALVVALGAWPLVTGARTLVRRGQSPDRLIVLGATAAAVAGVVSWFLRETLLASAGRRSDLTGRVEIWEAAWSWIADRPLLGHGYLASWTDPKFVAFVGAPAGQEYDSAHNSFVEVLLGGGVVGIVLFVALIVVLYAISAHRALQSRRDIWPLALFVFVLVENLTETLFVAGQLTVAILGTLMVVSSRPAALGRSARAELTSEQTADPADNLADRQPGAAPAQILAGQADISAHPSPARWGDVERSAETLG